MLSKPNVSLVDDAPYREGALQATFQGARHGKRAISFCDMVIRLSIEDTNLRVKALLTFNARDFVDVCRRKEVELL